MKNRSSIGPAASRRQAGRIADARDTCDVTVIHLKAVRRARASLPPDDRIQELASLLTLLGNPTRLKILAALLPAGEGASPELCVCDLAVVSGASKSMTSHQLRLLRTAGLVVQRRAGKLSFYRLAQRPVTALLAAALHGTSSSAVARPAGAISS